MTTQIRIGNDCHLVWNLLDEGEPYMIKPDAEIRLLDVHGRPVPIEVKIEGNIVDIIYRGKSQYTFGKYSLLLVENDGLDDMVTIDYQACFELVKHSPYPQVNKGDNLLIDVPQITSYVNRGEVYKLPIASENELGGVKPVAKTDEMTQPVGVDAEGKLFTHVNETDLTNAITAVNEFTDIAEPQENQAVFVKDKLTLVEVNKQGTTNNLYINLDINNVNSLGADYYTCTIDGEYTLYLINDKLYIQDSFGTEKIFFDLKTKELTPKINWGDRVYFIDKFNYNGTEILRICANGEIVYKCLPRKNDYISIKNETGVFKYTNDKWVKQDDVNLTGYLRLIPANYITQEKLDESGFVTMGEIQAEGYITEIPAEYITETELTAKNYTNKVELTQAEYNELPVKDPNTIYIITDSRDLDIPTKVSELTNDVNYTTLAEVQQQNYLTEVPAETTNRIDALEQEIVGASTTINEINTIIK